MRICNGYPPRANMPPGKSEQELANRQICFLLIFKNFGYVDLSTPLARVLLYSMLTRNTLFYLSSGCLRKRNCNTLNTLGFNAPEMYLADLTTTSPAYSYKMARQEHCYSGSMSYDVVHPRRRQAVRSLSRCVWWNADQCTQTTGHGPGTM